jgi:hypothetical protein
LGAGQAPARRADRWIATTNQWSERDTPRCIAAAPDTACTTKRRVKMCPGLHGAGFVAQKAHSPEYSSLEARLHSAAGFSATGGQPDRAVRGPSAAVTGSYDYRPLQFSTTKPLTLRNPPASWRQDGACRTRRCRGDQACAPHAATQCRCARALCAAYPRISAPARLAASTSATIASSDGGSSTAGGSVSAPAGSLVSQINRSKPPGESRKRSRAGPRSTQ